MTIRETALSILSAADSEHRTSAGTSHADVVANTDAIDLGAGTSFTMTEQAGATADATLASFTAPRAGVIIGVYTKLGTGCGGAETVTVDLQIGGVTCLGGLIALNAADTTDAKAGVLAAAPATSFTAGQAITVVIDQTTGGADTASDLSTCIAWRLV